eukprot:1367394-Amorphochlora_amoeboformis.AAC.2
MSDSRDASDTDSASSDDDQPVRRRVAQNLKPETSEENPSDPGYPEQRKTDSHYSDEQPSEGKHRGENVVEDEVNVDGGSEEVEEDEGEGEADEESGDDETKAENNEEKKDPDPWDVPRTGKFYLHDDRFDSGSKRGGRYRRRGGKQLWEAEEPMWTHDKFEELQKEPEPDTVDVNSTYGGGRWRNNRGRGRGRGRGARRRYRGRGGGRSRGRGRGRSNGGPRQKWVKKVSQGVQQVQDHKQSPQANVGLGQQHVMTAQGGGGGGWGQ